MEQTEQKQPNGAELARKLRRACALISFVTSMSDAELIAAGEVMEAVYESITDPGSALNGFFQGVGAVLDAEVLRRAAETVALPMEDV